MGSEPKASGLAWAGLLHQPVRSDCHDIGLEPPAPLSPEWGTKADGERPAVTGR